MKVNKMKFESNVNYLFVMCDGEENSQGKVVNQKGNSIELDNGDIINGLYVDHIVVLGEQITN